MCELLFLIRCLVDQNPKSCKIDAVGKMSSGPILVPAFAQIILAGVTIILQVVDIILARIAFSWLVPGIWSSILNIFASICLIVGHTRRERIPTAGVGFLSWAMSAFLVGLFLSIPATYFSVETIVENEYDLGRLNEGTYDECVHTLCVKVDAEALELRRRMIIIRIVMNVVAAVTTVGQILLSIFILGSCIRQICCKSQSENIITITAT